MHTLQQHMVSIQMKMAPLKKIYSTQETQTLKKHNQKWIKHLYQGIITIGNMKNAPMALGHVRPRLQDTKMMQ